MCLLHKHQEEKKEAPEGKKAPGLIRQTHLIFFFNFSFEKAVLEQRDLLRKVFSLAYPELGQAIF